MYNLLGKGKMKMEFMWIQLHRRQLQLHDF